MNKILSQLPAPVIAGVVREKNVRSAIAEIRNCLYDGAAMIDLHMSCLENSDEKSLKEIISSSCLPVLALNYNNTYDWQPAQIPEEERAASLLRAVKAGAAGVDMQGYTFHAPSKTAFYGEDLYSFTKGNPKEVITDEAIIEKQCQLIDQVHSMGAEVLLSCHPGIPMKRDQVVELALFLEKRKPDIIKIVTAATNEEEMLESIQAMIALKKEVRTPVAYHANGNAGSLSRIINPILGGHIAFCVDHYKESSTMGQLDLKAVKSIMEQIEHIK
ncbi:MAG: type I 3-dehydroquinate dehydratase [Clostridiales bacterium]|nr:type I 3-dehydroquinate dehydratase [Clostridiales bacterium]